jgi:hypothetical protein
MKKDWHSSFILVHMHKQQSFGLMMGRQGMNDDDDDHNLSFQVNSQL